MAQFTTASATVSWFDGVQHTRVYRSDGDTITDRCWDGTEWIDGVFSQPGSHVSASHWVDGSNLPYIRIYCTSAEQTVEWCCDAGGAWYVGGYSV